MSTRTRTWKCKYESATIQNARQKAEVSVVKKDSDTANVLDGGKYTLYAGNDIKNYAGQVIVTKGTALQTVTIGEDGKAASSLLRYTLLRTILQSHRFGGYSLTESLLQNFV